MHFISIHNSLPDVGLYWIPGICRDSKEIATSLWFLESFTLLLSDGTQALWAQCARVTTENILVHCRRLMNISISSYSSTILLICFFCTSNMQHCWDYGVLKRSVLLISNCLLTIQTPNFQHAALFLKSFCLWQDGVVWWCWQWTQKICEDKACGDKVCYSRLLWIHLNAHSDTYRLAHP